MRRVEPWTGALAATVLIFNAACGDDAPPPTEPVEPPVATTINVTPGTARLESIGATVQLTATVLDQRGQPMAGVSVTWASSDASVASVGSTGTVTAVANGSASVTATTASISGSASVTVAQQPVQASISPGTVSLTSIGETVQFAVEALDGNGHPVAGVVFTWSSSNASVATVDASGLATTTGIGSAEIAATAGGVRAAAELTVEVTVAGVAVSPPAHTMFSLGDTLRLEAEVVDANGNAIPDYDVTWASENSGIASVDMSGLVTSVRTGSTNIYASAGEFADSASISVAQLARRVDITPEVDTLEVVGDTLRLTAVARDANGNEVEDTDYVWTARHPHVVTVDDNGLVTATGKGSGTIQVQATRAGGNHVARASITVLRDSGGDTAGDAADQVVLTHPHPDVLQHRHHARRLLPVHRQRHAVQPRLGHRPLAAAELAERSTAPAGPLAAIPAQIPLHAVDPRIPDRGQVAEELARRDVGHRELHVAGRLAQPVLDRHARRGVVTAEHLVAGHRA